MAALATGNAPRIKASTTTPAGPGAVGLLILASLAAAAVGHGGHYRRIAEVCGALLVVAAVLLFGRYRSTALQPSRWAVVGIGVMIACTELTGILDGHPSGAVGPVSLLAGLAVVVAGTAVLDGPSRRQLADLVLALGVFLAGTAWLGVAFHLEPLGHPDGGLWRAATTVTYANAAAAVLGPLALWGLARTTTTRSWPARLAVVVLVSGLCATLSRAGIASFVVGLAVLIWMLGFRSLWSGAGLAVIGGLVAAVGLIPGMPSGDSAQPWWAVIGLVLGLGIGLVPRINLVSRGRGSEGRAAVAPSHKKLGMAALVLILVAGGAALIGLAGHSRLWSARVSVSSPDRTSLASVAWHMWLNHPVTGVGPERALFLWTTADNQLLADHYAHDEYLQLAVEQGAVGLGGLVALGTAVGVTVRQGRSPRRPRYAVSADLRALQSGAVAGLACLAVHSGFDFLWHVPAVLMVAALAVGLAAPLPRAEVLYPQTQEQEEA